MEKEKGSKRGACSHGAAAGKNIHTSPALARRLESLQCSRCRAACENPWTRKVDESKENDIGGLFTHTDVVPPLTYCYRLFCSQFSAVRRTALAESCQRCDCVLAPMLMTAGGAPNPSGPRFPHLQNGGPGGPASVGPAVLKLEVTGTHGLLSPSQGFPTCETSQLRPGRFAQVTQGTVHTAPLY